MTKQTINIIGIGILYNILEEFRDNLPFQLINFDKRNDFIKYFNENKLNEKISLIITTINNKEYLIKNNINRKDILIICEKKKSYSNDAEDFDLEYPTEIFQLIEKINIKLIKKKYDYQSKVIIGKYYLDLNSKIISYNNNKLKLTEKEMDIILFLNNNTAPQKINVLQKQVWGYSSELETHTVETHIYRLRKKISDKFNDNNFIISTDIGYIIE
tara:strand:- start:530 stop:1174 length:645 start_codon:yes stop_codon:yes gene_type:complete